MTRPGPSPGEIGAEVPSGDGPVFVGLDLGTSAVKALLVRGDGSVVGEAGAPLTVSRPHPGWSEQAPADWLVAIRAAFAELATGYRAELARVRGIGLSGHMHGATLVDERGEPLRPCILWNDTRAQAEAAALDAVEGAREISGNIVFPGFTAPKLAWVAANEPGTFEKVSAVLLPKDYVAFWLTGALGSEMSDASGTSWLDVGARAWSAPLLEAGGMRPDQAPELREGTGLVGTVRGELARELGLPEGVAVVAGGADNAAAACGVGALGEGDGFVSLGSSGVLLAARGGFFPDPASAVHTFCHAVPGRWYQMGVMLAAADCLNWLARVVGREPGELTRELDETAGGAARGGISAPQFFPYLAGERTPHNDGAIRGGFSGLDSGHGRADLTRAVLEGVAFGLRDCLEALKGTGARLDSLLAIGGGAKSRFWVELLSATLNVPLDLPAKGEFGAALGAARLAICGVTGVAPEDVMTRPEISARIVPDADWARERYDAWAARAESYARLRELQGIG